MQPADLEPLRAWLLESTGLEAELLGRQRLQRAVAQRLAERKGETLAEYQRSLLQDPAEQQRLIEGLVVGESWFLRESRSFEQLVQLGRRQRQRPLRLLSCGCSSGEEPYSLVIALLEAGIPPQQLEVEAIDISAVALERAAEGLYSSHSLRGMEPGRLRRFFDPEGRRWRLRPEIRGAVRFHRGSLQERLGSLSPGWHAVLCRNVMLYLHDQARRDLLLAIADRLAPDGLLLVAAAEAALVPADRYRRLEGGHGAGFALHNDESGSEQTGTSESALPRPQARKAAMPRQGLRQPDVQPPPRTRSVPAVNAASDPAPLVAAAPPSELEPDLHLRAARQLQQLGRPEQALAALRRCLYLDPSHREALTLRAELAGDLGRHDEAEQLRRRLARGTARGEG